MAEIVDPPGPIHLPQEIKLNIFKFLQDVREVKALASTGRSYHHAFLASSRLILTQVLKNQVHPEILTDAIAALRSSQIKQKAVPIKKSITAFLEGYFANPSSFCTMVGTYREALAVAKLSDDVQRFATGFTRLALSKHPITGQNEYNPTDPNVRESHRIERSLYRFELYCNLFRVHNVGKHQNQENELPPSSLEYKFKWKKQYNLFLKKFAPWEIEQLMCIHDYLFNSIAPAFEEFVKHDIVWGGYHLIGLEHGLNHRPVVWHKEYYLSQGLAFIRQLIECHTYDERAELLNCPKAHDKFLFDTLYNATEEGDNRLFSDLTRGEQSSFIHAPLIADDEGGPETAWRWANVDSFVADLMYDPEKILLRKRGYVMWDLDRLSEWNIPETSWNGSASWVQDVADLRSGIMDAEADALGETSPIRWELFYAGARGYWSKDDFSKIRWYAEMGMKDWRQCNKLSKECNIGRLVVGAQTESSTDGLDYSKDPWMIQMKWDDSVDDSVDDPVDVYEQPPRL